MGDSNSGSVLQLSDASGARRSLKLDDGNPLMVATRILTSWGLADIVTMEEINMGNVYTVAAWLTKGER